VDLCIAELRCGLGLSDSELRTVLVSQSVGRFEGMGERQSLQYSHLLYSLVYISYISLDRLSSI
jgi:hypothetical protein